MAVNLKTLDFSPLSEFLLGTAGDASQFCRLAQPGEGGKLLDIVFISAAGFGIGDVGEPFEFGGNVGQVAELGRRQRAPFKRNQVFRHHPAPVFLRTLPRCF